MKENAETIKLRVVYDASAKSEKEVSLSECFEKAPPLQNMLWDVRAKFRPLILCADIKRAFLKICINEIEKNYLRFYWLNNLDDVKALMLIRLLFGLIQSTFGLKGTLRTHFEKSSKKHFELIQQIKDDMYVNDIVTRGDTIEQISKIKNEATKRSSEGGFKLHKSRSNDSSLETASIEIDNEINYARE